MKTISFNKGTDCPKCKKGKIRCSADTEGKNANISTGYFRCDNCGYEQLKEVKIKNPADY